MLKKIKLWLLIIAESVKLCARLFWLLTVNALTGVFRPGKKTSGAFVGLDQPMQIFFYSQVVWDEVWQRPQELALGMKARRRVIFFSPVQLHRLTGSFQDKARHSKRVNW